MARTLKITALVTLLQQHDRENLERLRAQLPSNPTVALSLSPQLGGGAAPAERGSGGVLGREEGAVYVAAAIASLDLIVRRVPAVLDQLRTRLRRAKHLRTSGGIVAALSSAGLLGLVFSSAEPRAQGVAALANFSATACTLWAARQESPDHGGTTSLAEIFQQLAETSVRAELLLGRLRVDQQVGRWTAEVQERVQAANGYAATLLTIERLVGTANAPTRAAATMSAPRLQGV